MARSHRALLAGGGAGRAGALALVLGLAGAGALAAACSSNPVTLGTTSPGGSSTSALPSGGSGTAGATTATTATTAAPSQSVPLTTALAPAAGSVPRVDADGTVWLCRPGIAANPCDTDLDWTSVTASGTKTVHTASVGNLKPFDCFYVYPTVSTEPGANADLRVQAPEIGAAVSQASRFSQVCNVWAPMYRQRTIASLSAGLGAGKIAAAVAYASLLKGFEDYMAHDNDGRPIVFIGHSQGAAILIDLLRSHVDDDPGLRRQLAGAIILGGNVEVPPSGTVGATFQHIPICTAFREAGCVIAYSSFPSEPPAGALFGRPGQGVSLQSGQTATTGVKVACTNPAALAGGPADLQPFFFDVAPPAGITTHWVEYPALYRAECESSGGATWLDVAPISASDPRPKVAETLGPLWGLHLYDVNLGLGDLVRDVAGMEQAYAASA